MSYQCCTNGNDNNETFFSADIVPQKKDISAVSEDDADIDTPNTGIDNIAEDFIPELHDDEVDADFSIPIQEHRPGMNVKVFI